MQRMASKNQGTTTILLNDAHAQSNLQAVTPIVKYEAPYGKTEVLQSTPFLVEQRHKNDIGINKTASGAKRSSLKNILNNVTPKTVNIKSNSSNSGQTRVTSPPPGTQASICFVPVGKPISDIPGSSQTWTMLQGFVYSQIQMSSNGTYSIPCTAEVASGTTDVDIAKDTSKDTSAKCTVYVPKPDVYNNTQQTVPKLVNNCVTQKSKDNSIERCPNREDNEFDTIEESDTMGEKTDPCGTSVVNESSHCSSIKLAADVHVHPDITTP